MHVTHIVAKLPKNRKIKIKLQIASYTKLVFFCIFSFGIFARPLEVEQK